MRILLCNCPPAEADGLARALIERRLAACVNILPAVTSVYRWEGAVQTDTESTLLVKVAEPVVERAVAALSELHSYTVPEVLVLPVDTERSFGPYVRWVRESCGSEEGA